MLAQLVIAFYDQEEHKTDDEEIDNCLDEISIQQDGITNLDGQAGETESPK